MSPEDIKRLRSRLGFSQQQLATVIGVSVGSVHRWETGTTKPIRLAVRRLHELEASLNAG